VHATAARAGVTRGRCAGGDLAQSEPHPGVEPRGDTIRVASMDRLARSVIDLAQLVQEITSRGVTVEFIAERLGFDPGTDDAFATLQLHLLGAVAQLERSLIQERQREGIEIAKTRGVYRGRARKLTPKQVIDARHRVQAGIPKAKVARDLGCSRRVLYDALSAQGAYTPDPRRLTLPAAAAGSDPPQVHARARLA